jgi:hypothetical protein
MATIHDALVGGLDGVRGRPWPPGGPTARRRPAGWGGPQICREPDFNVPASTDISDTPLEARGSGLAKLVSARYREPVSQRAIIAIVLIVCGTLLLGAWILRGDSEPTTVYCGPPATNDWYPSEGC